MNNGRRALISHSSSRLSVFDCPSLRSRSPIIVSKPTFTFQNMAANLHNGPQPSPIDRFKRVFTTRAMAAVEASRETIHQALLASGSIPADLQTVQPYALPNMARVELVGQLTLEQLTVVYHETITETGYNPKKKITERVGCRPCFKCFQTVVRTHDHYCSAQDNIDEDSRALAIFDDKKYGQNINFGIYHHNVNNVSFYLGFDDKFCELKWEQTIMFQTIIKKLNDDLAHEITVEEEAFLRAISTLTLIPAGTRVYKLNGSQRLFRYIQPDEADSVVHWMKGRDEGHHQDKLFIDSVTHLFTSPDPMVQDILPTAAYIAYNDCPASIFPALMTADLNELNSFRQSYQTYNAALGAGARYMADPTWLMSRMTRAFLLVVRTRLNDLTFAFAPFFNYLHFLPNVTDAFVKLQEPVTLKVRKPILQKLETALHSHALPVGTFFGEHPYEKRFYRNNFSSQYGSYSAPFYTHFFEILKVSYYAGSDSNPPEPFTNQGLQDLINSFCTNGRTEQFVRNGGRSDSQFYCIQQYAHVLAPRVSHLVQEQATQLDSRPKVMSLDGTEKNLLQGLVYRVTQDPHLDPALKALFRSYVTMLPIGPSFDFLQPDRDFHLYRSDLPPPATKRRYQRTNDQRYHVDEPACKLPTIMTAAQLAQQQAAQFPVHQFGQMQMAMPGPSQMMMASQIPPGFNPYSFFPFPFNPFPYSTPFAQQSSLDHNYSRPRFPPHASPFQQPSTSFGTHGVVTPPAPFRPPSQMRLPSNCPAANETLPCGEQENPHALGLDGGQHNPDGLPNDVPAGDQATPPGDN